MNEKKKSINACLFKLIEVFRKVYAGSWSSVGNGGGEISKKTGEKKSGGPKHNGTLTAGKNQQLLRRRLLRK